MQFTALLLLALLGNVLVEAADTPCYDKNNTVHPCPATCFCESTYSRQDIQDTDNLTYSEKHNLLLHLFEPPKTDTRAKRPAMVMIHGGGFVNGNRNNKAGIIGWSQALAMRGYVAVSIDYRLEGSSDFEKSNTDAMYDARAAVRWLRKNAAEYRIDPDRIGAFGSSAGAMTVAFMTTVDGDGDSGNPGFSSDISVGISLSGALLPNPGMANITAKQPPYLDFHGCKDSTVPYSSHSKPGAWGSGVDTVEAMRRAGREADLYSFPGKGHVPWGDLSKVAAASSMLGFLAKHLDLAHAECPAKPGFTV